ncbi:MAG: leucine-rich repeat domain-containing protein [Sedimentisphaerales bacterium]|nr:leucine-rich repeat domain-containing protein [Sedimentisphaerales bacterium]
MNLRELYLGNDSYWWSSRRQRNKVSDISALAGMVNLNRLQLGTNLVRDLSPLKDLRGLGYLDLGGCPLKAESLGVYIPRIVSNNPGVQLEYDRMILVDDDGPNDPGPDDPLVSDPQEDGSWEHPYDSIREGIDAVVQGYHVGVIVMDGVYRGPGNRDIGFGGKNFVLRSDNSPNSCVIDAQGSEAEPHRGFRLSGVFAIDGFTITGGYGEYAGGVYCGGGAAGTISNCIIVGNRPEKTGGGIFDITGDASSGFSDIVVMYNEPDGISVDARGHVEYFSGRIRVAGNDIVGGVLFDTDSYTDLELVDCNVVASLSGGGRLIVPGGSRLVIGGAHEINIGHIECGGKLELRDDAWIRGSSIEIARDSFGIHLYDGGQYN